MATPALAEEKPSGSSGRCGSITSSSNQQFFMPVEVFEAFFGWQNPLYRLMKGIPFGMGQSLSFGTDGQELDGFGFPVFSPFGAGNGIGTLSGGSGCPEGCCCKGCMDPNEESREVKVCLDCVTGRVVAYAAPGGCGNLLCYCYFEFSAQEGATFAPVKPGTDAGAPTCEECNAGSTADPNCGIVCEGQDWDPPGFGELRGPVNCFWCSVFNPGCWENGRPADCASCKRAAESMLDYYKSSRGRITCVVPNIFWPCYPPE